MNSNELVLNGNDPYFTPVRNILNSISPFLFFAHSQASTTS